MHPECWTAAYAGWSEHYLALHSPSVPILCQGMTAVGEAKFEDLRFPATPLAKELIPQIVVSVEGLRRILLSEPKRGARTFAEHCLSGGSCSWNRSRLTGVFTFR